MRRSFWFAAWLVFLAGRHVGALAGEAKIEGLVSVDGTLQLILNGRSLCAFRIGLNEPGWKSAIAAGDLKTQPEDGRPHAFTIKTSPGVLVHGQALIASAADGGISAQYQFTPTADIALLTLHVNADFPAEALAGRDWSADGKSGQFPRDMEAICLCTAHMKSLAIDLAQGEMLHWQFDEPTQVTLQDNRQWANTFSVRIGPQGDGTRLKKGETVQLRFHD